MLSLRFYGPLNLLLPASRRQRTFLHPLELPAAARDVIESLGIPHTELGLLLVDGEPRPLAHRLEGMERVAVYPPMPTLSYSPLWSAPPEPLRFVVDGHLGSLARRLRLLGLDTWYSNNAADPELARISSNEGRVLLTRDRGLLKRSTVLHGHLVLAEDTASQLAEVIEHYDLHGRFRPLTRCTACNTPLADVEKAAVLHRLPPRVRERQQEFRRCPGCDRIYWPGTHHARLVELVRLAANGP